MIVLSEEESVDSFIAASLHSPPPPPSWPLPSPWTPPPPAPAAGSRGPRSSPSRPAETHASCFRQLFLCLPRACLGKHSVSNSIGHKMARPKRASLLSFFLGGGPHRFRQPLLVLALALHKLLLEAHLHTPGLRLRLRGLQRLQLVLEQPTLPCFIVEDRVS